MVKATSPVSRKSQVAVSVESGGVVDGKVRKPSVVSSSASSTAAAAIGGEQFEIQMYLSKLKELVPNMPRNRKVSKVEVIEHVIDYICDLQTALEHHPASRGAAALVSAMLINNNNNNTCTLANNNSSQDEFNNNNITTNSPAACNNNINNNNRQPLCVISATVNTCAQEVNHQVSPLGDKNAAADCASRTVSC